MKIKRMLCSVFTAGTVLVSGISASATDVIINPVTDQPDYISGRVNVIATTDSDTYVSIYKTTPENKDGYLVYDTVIEADSVHTSNVYVFNLEYNNFNFESGTFEGDYLVKIGIPEYKTSDKPVYYQQNIIIDDFDYVGTETEYTYKINLTEEKLSAPISEVTGTDNNKTVNLTFTSLEHIQGDANSDGIVNIRDAAFIATNLANQKPEAIPPYADYNGDDATNIRDAAAIASFLATPR